MRILNTLSSARHWIAHTKNQQKTIALVPTMGNLHEGHLVLVDRAKQLADLVGASIFVNPMQFGPTEDFDHYPRTFKKDCDALTASGVDFVFAPNTLELYPNGYRSHTMVTVPDLSNRWCGAFRPGHFTGVATAVLKLFSILSPNVACFGEKDFQQFLVVKQMVEDLGLPIQIVPVATVREPDGLAMSSRNQYLNGLEREQAPRLYQTLQDIQQQIKSGKSDFRKLEQNATILLEKAGFKVEYIAVCNATNLAPAEYFGADLVVLAAVYLGKTRLIDNIRFG